MSEPKQGRPLVPSGLTHELKILPSYFKAVRNGSKTFEIRDNSDRGFQRGDVVILKEWDQSNHYTGNSIHVIITYVTSFKQQPDYVVFSFDILRMDINNEETILQ